MPLLSEVLGFVAIVAVVVGLGNVQLLIRAVICGMSLVIVGFILARTHRLAEPHLRKLLTVRGMPTRLQLVVLVPLNLALIAIPSIGDAILACLVGPFYTMRLLYASIRFWLATAGKQLARTALSVRTWL
ncbi:hypothetical protein C4552_03030 [Candidatus Parcubacteria bacterium]|nr:MAG: hypothetical protein C4552_03030 [Candidatus Parcubacteria bacterium]